MIVVPAQTAGRKDPEFPAKDVDNSSSGKPDGVRFVVVHE